MSVKPSFKFSTVLYSNGLFQGFLQDNMRDGLGIYIWDSGEIYYGEWFQDNMQGEGYYFQQTGSFLHSLFQNNKVHGPGVLKLPDSSLIMGYWDNGHLNGLCYKYIPIEDEWFLCEFKEKQFHQCLQKGKCHPESFPPDDSAKNFGELTDMQEIIEKANRRIQENTGKNVEFIHKNFDDGGVYMGLTRDKIPHGYGVFKFADEKMHVGLYYNGIMEGPCFIQFQNDDFYCGELRKGRFEGVSLFYQKSNETWYHSEYGAGNRQRILGRSSKINNELKEQISRTNFRKTAEITLKQYTPFNLYDTPLFPAYIDLANSSSKDWGLSPIKSKKLLPEVSHKNKEYERKINIYELILNEKSDVPVSSIKISPNREPLNHDSSDHGYNSHFSNSNSNKNNLQNDVSHRELLEDPKELSSKERSRDQSSIIEKKIKLDLKGKFDEEGNNDLDLPNSLKSEKNKLDSKNERQTIPKSHETPNPSKFKEVTIKLNTRVVQSDQKASSRKEPSDFAKNIKKIMENVQDTIEKAEERRKGLRNILGSGNKSNETTNFLTNRSERIEVYEKNMKIEKDEDHLSKGRNDKKGQFSTVKSPQKTANSFKTPTNCNPAKTNVYLNILETRHQVIMPKTDKKFSFQSPEAKSGTIKSPLKIDQKLPKSPEKVEIQGNLNQNLEREDKKLLEKIQNRKKEENTDIPYFDSSQCNKTTDISKILPSQENERNLETKLEENSFGNPVKRHEEEKSIEFDASQDKGKIWKTEEREIIPEEPEKLWNSMEKIPEHSQNPTLFGAKILEKKEDTESKSPFFFDEKKSEEKNPKDNGVIITKSKVQKNDNNDVHGSIFQSKMLENNSQARTLDGSPIRENQIKKEEDEIVGSNIPDKFRNFEKNGQTSPILNANSANTQPKSLKYGEKQELKNNLKQILHSNSNSKHAIPVLNSPNHEEVNEPHEFRTEKKHVRIKEEFSSSKKETKAKENGAVEFSAENGFLTDQHADEKVDYKTSSLLERIEKINLETESKMKEWLSHKSTRSFAKKTDYNFEELHQYYDVLEKSYRDLDLQKGDLLDLILARFKEQMKAKFPHLADMPSYLLQKFILSGGTENSSYSVPLVFKIPLNN